MAELLRTTVLFRPKVGVAIAFSIKDEKASRI
jgi:hypothetical protein